MKRYYPRDCEDESYYQDNPDVYEWSDEWGWIDKRTGEIVMKDDRQERRSSWNSSRRIGSVFR